MDFNDNCKCYKWTEEDLKLTEQMLGNIKHNINNPLTIIYSKALKLEQMEDLRVQRDLKYIMNNCERIKAYLDSLESKVANLENKLK